MSRFYGFPVAGLDPAEKLALAAALPALQAEEQLRATGGADLTIDGYYDLILTATGSPERAAVLARKRRADLLRAGLTPT